MLANSTAQPTQLTVVAASPAQPPSANGLATGRMVWVIGPDDRLQASTSTAVPAMATTATTRQRRERSRPSGSRSSGRVTASRRPTAHRLSPARAASRAAGGSGRPATSSWLTHGSQGTFTVQTRPAAAYSQPIGFSGRRRVRTSPTVANSSQMAPSTAPSTSTSAVSGRVTRSVTTSPPVRQPRVASHNDQASTVRLLAPMASTVRGQRYGSVTTRRGGRPG
jgi:hypothetical protein